MLKLAEVLALAGLHVTFLTIPFIHNRLIRHNDIETRFASYPDFLLKTVSVGLPEDHPRSGERKMELFISLNMVTRRLLKHMLATHQLGSNLSPSVSCIIADGTLAGFTTDIATEIQIPSFIFIPSVLALSGHALLFQISLKPESFLFEVISLIRN
ncbi:hypothetical protein FNV43_RR24669 [Rhamnella rubrinervis]|uniref:Uncharacterized protein n=1 Tax=Rhamnella rubrinervis TaxID=2594499 RepID=A0A8K0DYJ3_9ROSA|nr:hypothetical protein FNV43_RR24669 [Rhamnella rubrinervis]